MMRHFSKRIHMIGIGGAGMYPLAEILHSYGHRISGSDQVRSKSTDRLESMGMNIQYNHTPDLVQSAEMVVYSSAVQPDNQERVWAVAQGIPVVRRAEVLGDIMRTHFTVCIAGTHGKTTTTSMVGAVCNAAELYPTVMVGGMIKSKNTNAVIGKKNLFIAEADEYDRSFLALYPSVAIITNVEEDHLDCYKDIGEIQAAFIEFAQRVPFYGAVIMCADDAGVQTIIPEINRSIITYGTENADYMITNIQFRDNETEFTVLYKGKELGIITTALSGTHNALNALAAIALANELGIPFGTIKEGFQHYDGVHRRFEVVSAENDITIIDDYAHHPSEIRATLDAARARGFKRIIAVFQPHLYTRTRDFAQQFAEHLMEADNVVITGIYQSREKPIEGVSADMIVQKMENKGYTKCTYIAETDALPGYLKDRVQSGDAVIFMGAGDIGDSAKRLKEVMNDA